MRLAGLALAVAVVAPAQAQQWPAKPIRMIVGFAPGGGTDVTARVVAPMLGDGLGQRVVVDNRPGANGVLGAELTAKSPPDGYTVLMINSGHTVNPGLYGKLPYDSLRDFAPVTLVAMIANLLVIHPSVPVRQFPELVALARRSKDAIHYGSGGVGASSHLSVELLNRAANIRLAHVPYKSGGLSATALLAGEVAVSFNTIPSSVAYVKAGRLRALGVSSLKRSLALPDVPAIAEMGYPGFEASGLAGILAPAGTPAEVLDRLQAETAKLIKRKEVIERFIALGLDPVGNTPAELGQFLRADLEKWTKLVRTLDLKGQ
jgi:tripartite-type tricarboxylate transporter receptor subunit TctC